MFRNRRYWRQQPFEADRLHRAANFGGRIMVYLHNSHVAIRLGLVFFIWIVAAFVGWAHYRATTFRYWGWRPWTVTTNITATVPNMQPHYETLSNLKNLHRRVAEEIAHIVTGVGPGTKQPYSLKRTDTE